MADIAGSGRARRMLQGIISLAKQMKLSIIAEGVEEIDQSIFVQDAQCDYCQGYLFSKPMSGAQTQSYCEQFLQ